MSVVSPDPALRWLAVLALALGGFGIGTTEFVAMGLLPDIAASLHHRTHRGPRHLRLRARRGRRRAVIAALTARMPRKAFLLGLMAVFTLGNLASVFAPTYESLMAARFVAGAAARRVLRDRRTGRRPPAGPRNRAKAVAHVMTGRQWPPSSASPSRPGWASLSVGGAPSRSSSRSACRRWARSGSGCPTSVHAHHQPADRTRRAQAPPGLVGPDRRHGRLRRHVRGLHLHDHHADRRRGCAADTGAAGVDGVRRRHGVGNLVGGKMADKSVIRASTPS